MSAFQITISQPSEKPQNLTMSSSEFEDFRNYLNQAILDLFSSQPQNPKQHLAVALCKSIGLTSEEASEFPEIQSLLAKRQGNLGISEKPYPEGVQVERRRSVAGESLSQENLTIEPQLFEKSEEVIERLKEILRKNVLFAHINNEKLLVIVRALEGFHFEPGQTIVKQNEEGNSCYFIENGKVSCFVEERGLVGYYGPGDSFGEASIMYGNKRGATVQAVTPSQLWKIDRITYKTIILQSLQPSEYEFSQLLNHHVFGHFYLEKLAPENFQQILKHIQKITCKKGKIFQLKTQDKYFHFIITGKVAAYNRSQIVQMANGGDFFGGREIFGLDSDVDLVQSEEDTLIFRIPEQILDSLLLSIKLDLLRLSELALF